MRTFLFVAVGAALLTLAGCSKVKNPMQRTLPDETQVLSGPNLSLPPSFELRPPLEGDTNEALLRGPAAADVSAAGADAWLVQQAQTQAGVVADAGVRADLELAAVSETRTTKKEQAEQGLIGRWLKRNQE